MTKHPRYSSAIAHLHGNGIRGTARFSQKTNGTLVSIKVSGLPASESGFFALHIHEGSSCHGADPGEHFNPGGLPHPRHAGDLPPLLSCGGRACITVLTGRFSVEEVIGRTLVIHGGPDDFHTQPSGNPGEKIALGTIKRIIS